ncbi:MAG: hypothetical protein WCE75_03315 [Terracidiphilus sp.]
MLTMLRLVHALLGLSALCAGIPVCFSMVVGRPLRKEIAHFLGFSLAASSVGMVLSVGHTSYAQWVAMLGVYVSGFAVLSLRKFQSNEDWGAALVMSTMCVLCLDAVVGMAHAFKLLATCNVPGLPKQVIPFSVSTVSIVLLFTFLSIVARKKIQHEPSASVMHKVTR